MKPAYLLLIVLFMGFVFFINEIHASESNNNDRSKIQDINLSFRDCVRNCVKAPDSRDEKAECTLSCTKKYRLHAKRPVSTAAAS